MIINYYGLPKNVSYFFDEGIWCSINIFIWLIDEEYFKEDLINNVQKINDEEEPCSICLETF